MLISIFCANLVNFDFQENCVNSVYCRCAARFLSNFCFVRKSSELICYLYMLYKGSYKGPGSYEIQLVSGNSEMSSI